MIVPTTSPSSKSHFAVETYYDVLEYVDCKHELAKLARTAVALQPPAEGRLYRTVALEGERDLREFLNLVRSSETRRIGALVKESSPTGMLIGREELKRIWETIRNSLLSRMSWST